MTIAKSLEKLKVVLAEIEAGELRAYLSDKKFVDDFDRSQFVVNYLYKTNHGAEVGMVPVLREMLNYCPPEKMREEFRERISRNNIDIKAVSGDITVIDKKNKEIEASIKNLNEKEIELKKVKERNEQLKIDKKELEDKIKELQKICDDLKESEIPKDSSIQSEMASIFESKTALEDYEVFLASCVKGRKMVLPKKNENGSIESDDAKIIHEFLLIKWYLNSCNPEFVDESFKKNYKQMMQEMCAMNDKGKEFFRKYMDATKSDIVKR